MSTSNTQNTDYDDEINLVELITNLWKERVLIVSSIALSTLICLLYIFITTPIYRVSAELSPPSLAELSYLNQTEFFSVTPEQAFSEFIYVADSRDHLIGLASSNEKLIKDATDRAIDENIFEFLRKKRAIDYPNTTKKTNDFTPEKYIFSYKGIDRLALNKLIQSDLDLASKNTIILLEKRYRNSLQLQINKLERKQSLQKKLVNDKLNARKAYVLATRSDQLKKLKEALKIAQSLNLNAPSSLSRLASGSGNRQVEINADLNNNQDPLYLRGIRLLSAEINNLTNLDDSVFLDSEIRNLENQKLLLESNRELEQLQEIIKETNLNNTVSFYSKNTNNPTTPIKPKKILALIISFLLGGTIGLFIAIGRIVYKNAKEKIKSNVV